MNNYIVSLTTVPNKFEEILCLTIDSLINQTLLPNKIIINIPKKYSFRMNNSEISIDKINKFIDKYSTFNCVINLIDEDYGPGTKLLGLLNSDIITSFDVSNTYIILVDDDIIYKPQMIESLDKEIEKNKVDVGSFCTYNYKDIIIGQGVDGFLMKLNLLDKFLQYYSVIKGQDYINYHDDFYFSFYFKLINKYIHRLTSSVGIVYDLHSRTFIDALVSIQGEYSRENLNIKSYQILTNLHKEGSFDFLHL